VKVTEAQRTFLRDLLKWGGAATSQEIGPIVYRSEDAARRTCKRRGYVTFDKHYWRITDLGRAALSEETGGEK
jgi:hypothetical protein